MRALNRLFQQADDRYNSGLFHFPPKRAANEAPDCPHPRPRHRRQGRSGRSSKSLYYPDCPYVFSVLPADILGQVYEQFLGKVIRLDGRHRAVVEEKPEVRKAGGVYLHADLHCRLHRQEHRGETSGRQDTETS